MYVNIVILDMLLLFADSLKVLDEQADILLLLTAINVRREKKATRCMIHGYY